MTNLLKDLRYAARLLTRKPALTIVASLTLALGIGVNTAIFSVINGLLLRPLPYEQPDRLVFLDGVFMRPEGDSRFQLSYAEFADMASAVRSFSAAAPWSNAWGLALEGGEGARRLPANFVGRGYFEILRARAALGRTFVDDDHRVGDDGRMVAILSDGVWRDQFGGDPAVVGREVRLQGRPFIVIGVMPPTFHDVALSQQESVEVWVPIERAPALFGTLNLSNRNSRQTWGVARLAPGASLELADAELRTISNQLATSHPQTNTNFRLQVTALSATFFADARRPLWMLLAGAVFVLLIGCANVANLLLVQSAGRTREIAIRLAVGATRSRVIRQLLLESLLLAALGAGLGVALAVWTTPALVTLSGLTVPGFTRVDVDRSALVAALALALMSSALFGMAPAVRAMRLNTRDGVSVGGSPTVARSTAGSAWIAWVEVTAAFALCAGALLMLQSFSALTTTSLLFRDERLLTVQVELPQDRYPTPLARARFGAAARERLSQLPGVEHVVLWGPSMFGRSTWVAFIAPEEQLPSDDQRVMVWRHSTNPGGLGDLGIPIISGRDLADTDTLDSPLVAVVSEATARRLWPGQDAVGRRFRAGAGAAAATFTVVGVAADARHRGRFRFSQGTSAHAPQLDIYLSFSQRPNGLVALGVRTSTDPASYTRAVTQALAGLDPALPVYDVAPLSQRLRREESSVGFAALLINIYAVVAVTLAAVGVYGVVAFRVSSRVRELGIRSALGAEPARLLADVVGSGMRIVALAVVTGLVVSTLLARAWQAMLFDVSATDLRLLGLAALVLLGVGLAATAIPARRAARIDPLQALRIE